MLNNCLEYIYSVLMSSSVLYLCVLCVIVYLYDIKSTFPLKNSNILQGIFYILSVNVNGLRKFKACCDLSILCLQRITMVMVTGHGFIICNSGWVFCFGCSTLRFYLLLHELMLIHMYIVSIIYLHLHIVPSLQLTFT